MPNDIMLISIPFWPKHLAKKSGYWKSVRGLEPHIFDAVFIYKEKRIYLPVNIEESNRR